MRSFKILLEFSETKSMVIQKINDVEEKIFQHLILLYVTKGKHSTTNHWKKEVYAFITKFSRYKWKSTKKLFDPEFYYFHLCLAPLTLSNDVNNLDWNISGVKMELEIVGDKYKNLKKKLTSLNIQKMLDAINSFYKEISIAISEDKLSEKIYTIIDNTILK